MSRSQRSQLPLIAPVPSIFHSASSKRLSKARATTPISVASSSSASSGVEESSHELPIGDYSVVGEAFEVDFERVSRTEGRLVAARLGYRVRHKSQLEDDGKRSKLWLCKLCHQSHRNNDAKIVNGTAHIARHLQNVHRVDPVLGLLPETPSQSRFSSPFEAAKVAGSSTPIAHSPWQEEALQSALVDWAIVKDLSFAVVVSPATRGLLTWNRSPLLPALPNSTTTFRKYVLSALEERKVEVRELLQAARGRISISVDVWTSSNHLSFLGVVAHFVDTDFKQQDTIIAFRNLYGDHTGAAQASIIRAVFDDYEISRKFHCFVGDNASSNDAKLIEGLNLHPNVNIDASHRIRCAGHIINLVVKATIYGEGVSKWEEELAAAAPKEQFRLFRQLGVVGRLHNFVNAVCVSHKRRELFNEVQGEVYDELLPSFATLELRQDGGVRWNSVYLMLLRCLELKEPIKRFIRRLRDDEKDDDDASDDLDYSPLTDKLTDDDWDDVQELVNFLQAPYEMTKRLEGNNSQSGFGSLWQTLPNLQALWAHYTDAKERPQSRYMASAVSYGWEKLNSYFHSLIMEPDVSYYSVATLLHPRLRLNWFQSQWKNYPNWYRKAHKSLEKVFKEYLAAEIKADDSQDSLLEPPSRRKLSSNSNSSDLYERTMAVDLHLLTKAKNKRQRRAGQVEEYFESLVTDLTTNSNRDLELLDDPWQWWLQAGRNRYPILFKIATDFLSVPSTSCDCERAFSSARQTITCDRNSLHGDTIEAIQLQKGWLRRDVVKSPLRAFEKYVQNLDKRREIGATASLAGASSSTTSSASQ